MIKAGVLTVSDKGSRGERIDESGKVLTAFLETMGADVTKYAIVPDERPVISSQLKKWADDDRLDLIVTTGGTGFSVRDVTPEATKDVIEREVPGLPETMRMETVKNTPHAMLSRAVAGIRGQCLIINLPGSVNGVRECFEVILPVVPHAVAILKGEAGEH
jgi:molybdopterin adenylyltransferase